MRSTFTFVTSFAVALCVGCALMVTSGSAHSESAEQALAQCTDALSFLDHESKPSDISKTAYNVGYCTGLVQGVTKTFDLYRRSTPSQQKLFASCPPETMDNGQAMRVYVRYLKDHPAALHLDASGIMLLALRDAFPCAGSSQQGR